MPTANDMRGLVGVWSSTLTPFTDNMDVDVESVERMVEHHLRLGVKGLFLAGTCGRGHGCRRRSSGPMAIRRCK